MKCTNRNARGKQKIESKFILVDSGDLRGSIHHTPSKNNVTIGTGLSLKYAAIHQFGGMAGRGKKVKIPARPYLTVNKGTNGLVRLLKSIWRNSTLKQPF